MIEKSLTAPRKKKVKGQLHKLAYITDKEAKLLQKSGGVKTKTSEGIFAYPPPGERGGPGSGAEGRSPGGGGGGGGGEGAMAANIAAAAARSRAAAAESAAESAAKAKRDMQATIAQAERAEANRVAQQAAEGKVDVGFQEALKKTADARQREQEFLDTGDIDALTDLTGFDTAPKVDTRDIQGEITDPDSVSYNPLLKALDEPKVDEGFKRYIRQVQQPIAPKPKSGIGTTLKNVALGVLAPQLLAGTALAKPYNLYRQYQTAKRFIPKGVRETIQTALTRTPTTMTRTPTTGTKTTTPLVASDRDGQRVKTVAEQVATGQGLESGEKLLGVQNTQKAELFKRRSMVEDILRKGSYQDKQLTNQQRNTLMNYVSQVDKYLNMNTMGV